MEIIQILPIKMSRTEGTYFRVEFKDEKGAWYKTDVVPGYRNYAHWAPVMKIGNKLFFQNLKFKDKNTVDADSRPMLLDGKKIRKMKAKHEAYEKANRMAREDPQKYWQTYLC